MGFTNPRRYGDHRKCTRPVSRRVPRSARRAAPARARCWTSWRETVARHPGRIAIDAVDAVLTYAELSDAADRLAAELRAAGVGPGDRVGIRLASGSSSLYVGILGVLRAGAAYVPVDADDPAARAAALWESAAVCGVLQDELSFTARTLRRCGASS